MGEPAPERSNQEGKTNVDLLEQEIVSGSGISWAIQKSASWPRHITMPASHHSVFLQAGCPSCHPTNNVKALSTKATVRLYGVINTRFSSGMHVLFAPIFTDHIGMVGNAIASVRLSICLFPLYIFNRLTFGLDLLHVCGSLTCLAGIETEWHRSRSRCSWSDLDLDRRQFSSFTAANLTYTGWPESTGHWPL